MSREEMVNMYLVGDSKRSITMTAEDAFFVFVRHPHLGSDHAVRAVAVAREAERRLIAKLRAIPVERLVRATAHGQHVDGCDACKSDTEAVRSEILRALEEET